MRFNPAWILLCGATVLPAQQPQVSPLAAYEQATRPNRDRPSLRGELVRPLHAQYAMLGQPLPNLQFSLETMKPKPVLDPELSAATALLVFPPWCAQCVRMAANDLLPAATQLKRGAVQLYALVAAPLTDLPPLVPPKPGPGPGPPMEQMRHTPTIVMPPETLVLLHATDLPWVVVTDHAGIVRFMGVAPENALRTGRYIDRATDHVAEMWPSKFVPVPPPAH